LVKLASVLLAIMMIINRNSVRIVCIVAKHASMDISVLPVRRTESKPQNVSVLQELMTMVFRKYVLLASNTAKLVLNLINAKHVLILGMETCVPVLQVSLMII
jgi:hypothetical protein